MSAPAEPAGQGGAALAVEGIHAGYGAAEILHDISLDVAGDEIVSIIGPNGAGKSTLLKTIMGYVLPTQGRVQLDGHDLTTLAAHQRVRRGIAYVPQLDNVFPSLTVAENLRMGAYTLPNKDIEARAQAQYEGFPRLAERRHQRVSTMSGGERQMLAMARALMTDPRLLLLDEPSAALSPKLTEQVFENVAKIHAEGRSVLIVEQNAESALRISDRCVVLVDGRNDFVDRADRVLADPKLRTAFLGG